MVLVLQLSNSSLNYVDRITWDSATTFIINQI